jgi:NADH-quinone oxidoreductase subunit B
LSRKPDATAGLGGAFAYPWQVPLSATAPAPKAFCLSGAPSVGVVLVEAGLACCGLEVGSALTRGLLEPAEAGSFEVSILLISGTVTAAVLPALQQVWADLPAPKAAVAFGACATAGGPYWDAPQVRNGVADLLPIAAVVAGCPPRPEALITAITSAAASAA